MSSKILLTGANGRTGRAVLKSLVFAKHEVRVFIRDAAQAPELEALGAVEHAVGDLEDASSVSKAVRGVEKVLHIGPPMHANELDHVITMIHAAKEHGVSRFIYYSVMHPLARDIRHHRLKLDAEERLIASGLPFVVVQPSRYMQHLETIWDRVVSEGIHAMPFSTKQRFNVVDLQDLADACAIVAGDDKFLYGTYELAGPQGLSQEDMAAALAEVLGRHVEARRVEISTMRDTAMAAGAVQIALSR